MGLAPEPRTPAQRAFFDAVASLNLPRIPIPIQEAPVALNVSQIQPDNRLEEMNEWWLARAQDEINQTVPKMIEYGSGDLAEVGRQMAEAMGLAGFTEQELAELGIYFYVVGKMARWTSAIRTGRRVSDDTLFDVGVYIRMAQRIREKGGLIGE